LAPADPIHHLYEVRVLGEVATGPIGRPIELLEAAKAILYVGRVLRFADFPVVEDRDPKVDLPLDDFGDRLTDEGVGGALAVRHLSSNYLALELNRTMQAAGMRCANGRHRCLLCRLPSV
jgi:hypothetical protein